MIEQNKSIFDRLNITKWHNAGYTGKRIKAITYEFHECWDHLNVRQFDPSIPLLSINGNDGHGTKTAAVFFEVCPDAVLYPITESGIHRNDGTHEGNILKSIAWIEKEKPCVGFRSISSTKRGWDNLYKNCFDFLSVFNSAGNSGADNADSRIADEFFFGVGAVFYSKYERKWVSESYSSHSPHVDFSSPTNVYIRFPGGMVHSFPGTSCSAPMAAGMAGLVNDFFIDKIGRPLTHYEMIDFIKENCTDINSPGHDVISGWGVFALPEINSIDLSKYEPAFNIGEDVDEIIKDNEFKEWSREAGEWAVSNGLLFGDENGNYKLSSPCTREQMVVFLYRLYKLATGK